MTDLLMSKIIQHIKKDETTDCWIWLGQISNSGYGKLKIKDENNRIVYKGAAELSYMVHIGPIPAGHIIINTCNNRLCVNPEHLKANQLPKNTT